MKLTDNEASAWFHKLMWQKKKTKPHHKGWFFSIFAMEPYKYDIVKSEIFKFCNFKNLDLLWNKKEIGKIVRVSCIESVSIIDKSLHLITFSGIEPKCQWPEIIFIVGWMNTLLFSHIIKIIHNNSGSVEDMIFSMKSNSIPIG